MSAPYRVEADIGAYSLVSQDNDPAAYGLADPFVLSYGIPKSKVAPMVQRNPDEATINVVAPDASTYNFTIGDQVRAVAYSDHTPGPCYAFFGRIADQQAQPHKLGILYTLTCVDYIADLAGLKAGRVDYPQETSWDRVNRMLAENGIGPLVIDGLPPGLNPTVVARTAATAGTIALSDAIEEILAGWQSSQPNNELGLPAANTIVSRYELRPNISNPGGIPGQGTLDPVSPFKVVPIYRPQGWNPPAHLATTPNVHLTVSTADSSPATDSLVLDAGHVDFGPLFTQQKGMVATRVVVSSPGVGYVSADWNSWGTYIYRVTKGTVEGTVLTRVTANWLNDPLAFMYRGTIEADPGLAWTVGELTWRAGRTQAAGWEGPDLRRVCTVARVDAVNPSSHVPTGKAWLVGVVDTLKLTLNRGEVVVSFTLAPMHYTATGPSVVPHQATFASTPLAGVLFNQLSPTDTFADYLLLHD